VTRNGTFTPANTRAHTAKIRAAFQALDIPEYDKEATFRLDVHFYLGTRRHVDGDNLLKLVKDALNVVAYDDDWRVYDSRAMKWHTTRERARTEIFLYTIPKDREEAA
jgi:Holliday junction resolvase RusA-like endonuclease